mgnify:CR=1 FL=1
MKNILNILITLFILMSNIKCTKSQDFSFKNGDIIFHTSLSSQSKFIQEATNSKVSHVGIIYRNDEEDIVYVFEAVEPVKITPLIEWVERGENNQYKVYRSTVPLSQDDINKIYDYCFMQKDKHYDSKFQWNDDKIYCSELVWYAYKSIGVELSQPKTFSDFNISSKEIQQEIIRRYGDKFVKSEPVVSPQCLTESKYLDEIFSNY